MNPQTLRLSIETLKSIYEDGVNIIVALAGSFVKDSAFSPLMMRLAKELQGYQRIKPLLPILRDAKSKSQ